MAHLKTAIITLARYVSRKDQEEIMNEVMKTLDIPKKHISRDSWAPDTRILITGSTKTNVKALERIEGVWRIFLVDEFQCPSNLTSLTELIAEKLNAYEDPKLSGEIVCKIRIPKGVPFHAKALADRLKRKKIQIRIAKEREKDLDFFIEFHSDQSGQLWGRIGRNLHRKTTITAELKDLELVLVDSYTKQEVADFLRLGISFKLPVRFVFTDVAQGTILVKKSSQITKGKDKIPSIEIESVEKIIERINLKKNQWKILGFSLWSKYGDQDLVDYTRSNLGKSEEIGSNGSDTTNFSLLFGNEREGLPRKLRKACDRIFHLGTEMSEPMRASQACAYALALLSSGVQYRE